MNIGCQASKKCVTCLATARFDREPAVQSDPDFLYQAAAPLRSSITFQIPIGFEDETGFHCGVPWTQDARPYASVPVINYTNANLF